MSVTAAALAHTGGHAECIQRSSGQCRTQRPGPLERQATFRGSWLKRGLDLPHLVRASRPTVPTRANPLSHLGGPVRPSGSCQQASPSSSITWRLSVPLSTQRPLTTAAAARTTSTWARSVGLA